MTAVRRLLSAPQERGAIAAAPPGGLLAVHNGRDSIGHITVGMLHPGYSARVSMSTRPGEPLTDLVVTIQGVNVEDAMRIMRGESIPR